MTFRLKYASLCGCILGMLLGACDPHEFPSSGGGDPGKDFSVRLQFDDALPELRTLSGLTKASGQPARYRYTVELLRYLDDVSLKLTPDYVFSFTRSERISVLDTTVYLPIDPARYRVMVWMDRLDEEGNAGYDISNFEYITMAGSYETGKGFRDAFVGSKVLDLEGLTTAGSVVQESLTMTRPVARIRFYAPEALTFLSQAGVDAASMKVTLRYTSPIGDGYNVLRGKTMTTIDNVTLTATPEMNTDGELEFITDFLFTPPEGMVLDVDLKVTDNREHVLASFVGEVPILHGHETLATGDDGGGGGGGGGGGQSGGIGINPGFDSEIEVPISF